MSIPAGVVRRHLEGPAITTLEGGRTPETERSTTMRVMVMVKATKNSEAGVMPSEKLLADMGKLNEAL